MRYKKNNYEFVAPSKRKYKKYDAYKNGKYLTSFGDVRYQQYYDNIGHYSKLNHYDNERKRLYYIRHGKNATKESSKWFSHNYLW
jgi:hypothetical protein